jgi:hypothetical protein
MCVPDGATHRILRIQLKTEKNNKNNKKTKQQQKKNGQNDATSQPLALIHWFDTNFFVFHYGHKQMRLV